MYVSAIIAAGGRGHRLGGAQSQTAAGDRRADRFSSEACRRFSPIPSIDEVIVALPAGLAADPPDYLRRAAKPLRVVAGGERRQDSVAAAFREVAEHADIVIVHDAARPFVSADLIGRTIAAAAESGAALAAIQARDTVKLAGPPRGGWTVWTVRPKRIVRAANPRSRVDFPGADAPGVSPRRAPGRRRPERRCDRRGGAGRTGRLSRCGWSRARRRTSRSRRPEDVPLAEAIAATRDGRPVSDSDLMRIGTGYDLHRLVEGRPLVLGGVTIPADRGALGHSDADVRLPRGHRRDARRRRPRRYRPALSRIPIRAGRMRRASISWPARRRCSRRAASRSPTWTSRSCSSGRSCGRTSTRCAGQSPAASTSTSRA